MGGVGFEQAIGDGFGGFDVLVAVEPVEDGHQAIRDCGAGAPGCGRGDGSLRGRVVQGLGMVS